MGRLPSSSGKGRLWDIVSTSFIGARTYMVKMQNYSGHLVGTQTTKKVPVLRKSDGVISPLTVSEYHTS